MFPPNQRSKSIFRKNAEHYVAYNELHVIYHDTISCNILKLRCKCVQSVNKLQLFDQKKVLNFDFDWLTLGRPDRVKSSMFAFFVSANVVKLFF